MAGGDLGGGSTGFSGQVGRAETLGQSRDLAQPWQHCPGRYWGGLGSASLQFVMLVSVTGFSFVIVFFPVNLARNLNSSHSTGIVRKPSNPPAPSISTPYLLFVKFCGPCPPANACSSALVNCPDLRRAKRVLCSVFCSLETPLCSVSAALWGT